MFFTTYLVVSNCQPNSSKSVDGPDHTDLVITFETWPFPFRRMLMSSTVS